MNKYRVLKAYPKQITNSGRLVTLKPGSKVYLKREPQVVRLVKMGFLKPVVEMPKREKKPVKQPAAKAEPKQASEERPKQDEPKEQRLSKSEYLNKKKKGGSKDSESY